MKIIEKIALIFLLLIIGCSLGISIMYTKVWPYSVIKEIEYFIAGHPDEDTTALGKILNDLNILPARHLRKYTDRVGRPIQNRLKIGFSDRRLSPLVAASESAPDGAWLIYGVMDLKNALHGIVLVNAAGVVERIWPIKLSYLSNRPETRAKSLGFDVLADGSMIALTSSTLTRLGWCGEVIWVRNDTGFHHSITHNTDKSAWTWRINNGPNDLFTEVSLENGSILREFTIEDVVLANSDLHIFEMRFNGTRWKWHQEFRYGKSNRDPYHPNDIDPLPELLADVFPGFEAGDLLTSFRELNLVLVLDPDTLKVKWFSQGLTSRQHDADWNRNGTISVFDNRPHHRFSHITGLEVKKHKAFTIVDRTKLSFFSNTRGEHEILRDGSIIVVSGNEGRVVHLSASGERIFEFTNAYDTDRVLKVGNARYLARNRITELNEACQ